MRVGVIGAGKIATFHGPLILKQPNTDIVAIADKNVAAAKTLASKLKARRFYRDAKAMIEEEKPDVVHVLTPPQYHAQLSIMAMNHGCHVLVEKPMALSVADAEEMIRVAGENKVHLCVNRNLVFEDVVQRALELISMGAIGELVSIEACYTYDARRNPAILEEGAERCHWFYQLNGGPLQDLMPHPASLIFEFIPEIQEIQWVGQNRGLLPKGWWDEIRVLIKANIIGYISVSLNERPDIISLTIKGTEGIVEADLFNNILTLRRKSSLPRPVDRGLSGFRLTSQYLRGALQNIYKLAAGRMDTSGGIGPLISRFYESLRNGVATPISLEKDLRVVDLMTRVWPVPMMGIEKTKSLLHARKKRAEPTALVTGASGFIGTHLIKRLLSEDIRVRALVRPNSIHAGRLKKFDVDIVEGDLTDAEALYDATREIKTIYNVGAAMSNSWEEHYQTNIKGSEHLIRAALGHQVKRIVHVSTLGLYELLGARKNAIINEDSPYQKNPKHPYCYSKIEAEKLLFEAYRRHGLGVTILRPGIVIGPMGRVFFPHLGYRFRDRIFLLIGKGNTVLPLTYVENTVDAIYRASIEEKAIGQVYNLIDDGEITVMDYLEQFRKITGTKVRIISLPYIIPYSATMAYEVTASLGIVKKGLTSRSQLKWKRAAVRFDNTKAKTDFGWMPKVSLNEGLTRTFQWYAANSRH